MRRAQKFPFLYLSLSLPINVSQARIPNMASGYKRKWPSPFQSTPDMSSQRSRRVAGKLDRNRQGPPSTIRSGSSRHSTSSEQAQSLHPSTRNGNEVEDDEQLELVVMAVDVRERGTIGCAYYVAREERLFCMEEVRGGSDSFQTRGYQSNM